MREVTISLIKKYYLQYSFMLQNLATIIFLLFLIIAVFYNSRNDNEGWNDNGNCDDGDDNNYYEEIHTNIIIFE